MGATYNIILFVEFIIPNRRFLRHFCTRHNKPDLQKPSFYVYSRRYSKKKKQELVYFTGGFAVRVIYSQIFKTVTTNDLGGGGQNSIPLKIPIPPHNELFAFFQKKFIR